MTTLLNETLLASVFTVSVMLSYHFSKTKNYNAAFLVSLLAVGTVIISISIR